MTYAFKYRLQSAPTGSADGSGLVNCTMLAVVSKDGGAYVPIPGFERTIYLPYQDVKIVMDMPHSTAPQKTAKNAAFLELLKQRADDASHGRVPDWSLGGMTTWVASVDGSALEAARVNTYITVTLGLTYPLDFSCRLFAITIMKNEQIKIRMTHWQNIYEGRPAAVLGGGPSLPGDMERLPANCVLIAVNYHAFHFCQPDFMVYNDHPESDPLLADAIRQHQAVLVSPEPTSDIPFDIDVWTGFYSSNTAAWFGLWLGCDPVILCGMDCYQGDVK